MAKSIFTITTPRGDEVDIEADDEATAIRGAQTWDHQDFATSEAQAAGLDPDLVLRTMRQESGFRADAVSPKGARGPMQLMPATAKELGVNPDDPYDNIRGGVRYLKQQRDKFGSDELALAAYNAGPGAVQKHGGVPPYAETQNYVRSIQGGKPVVAPMAPTTTPRVPQVARPVQAGMVPTPTAPTQRGPTIAQDVWAGFAAPFKKLGHDVMEDYRQYQAEGQAGAASMKAGTYRPPSLREAAGEQLQGLGRKGGILADVVGLAAAPLSAVTRPVSRALSNVLPDPSVNEGGFGQYKPRRLQGEDKRALIEGDLSLALAAVKPGGSSSRVGGPLSATAHPRPKKIDIRSVDDLENLTEGMKARRTEAYTNAEANGFRFKSPELQETATKMAVELNDLGGADLYPKAAPLVQRMQNLADRGDLTPVQLERFRRQISTKLLKSDRTEADFGYSMRSAVDELMENNNAPDWQAARQAHMQYKKVEAVSDAMISAGDQAGSTYSGHNLNNVIRQRIRPLINPESSRNIENFSKAETRQARRVARGSPLANRLRDVAGLIDPRTMRGAVINGIAAAATGGASTPMAFAGMAAKSAAEAQTAKETVKLLNLLAKGLRQQAVPRVSYPGPVPAQGPTSPIIPLLSGRGLVGAGAIAAPAAREPPPRPRRPVARPARPVQRKK